MGAPFLLRLLAWCIAAVIIYVIGDALGVDPTLGEIILVGLVFLAIDVVDEVLK